MAKPDEAKTITTNPPGAPGAEETLAIEIPKDFEFDEEPKPKEAETPAAETKPEAAKPPSEEKKVPLEALHEERGKRQRADRESAYWRRIAADREKLTRGAVPGRAIEPAREAPKPPVKPDLRSRLLAGLGRVLPDIEKTYPELKPVHERLVEDLTQALEEQSRWIEGLHGEHQGRTADLDRALKGVNGWIADQQTLHRTRILRQQDAARRRYKDWDQVLTKAGVFEAVGQDPQTGQYGDPLVALRVFSATDSAEEAYRLSKSKLAYEREELGEGDGEGEEEPKPQGDKIPAKGEEGTAPEGEGAAERRGRAEVAKVVAGNADKPRGIRLLRSAGEGRGELRLNEDTRRFLDRLMEEDYERYAGLIGKNGGKQGRLYRWHQGGF